MSFLAWLNGKRPAPHVCDPDRSLRWKLRMEAGDILKTARIPYLRTRYPVDWGGHEIMNRAFGLYNAHHPARPQQRVCAPCHLKVFNWLLDQAFNDLHPDQQ